MCNMFTLNSRSFNGSVTVSFDLVEGGDTQLSIVFVAGHSKDITSIGYCTFQQLRIWVNEVERILNNDLAQTTLCDYENVFTISLNRSSDDEWFLNAKACITRDSFGGSICCWVTQMLIEREDIQIMRDCFNEWICLYG